METVGFEPMTSALRTQRSPKWSAKRASFLVPKISTFYSGMRTTQRNDRVRFAAFLISWLCQGMLAILGL